MINKKYNLTKNELLERTGTIKQFCGIEKVRYTEGKAKDVDAFFFRTGSGFNFSILADRCMDIYHAEYNGSPLAYYTTAGICSPLYYDNSGWNWVKTFGGGLLQTCGLMNVGPACEHEGENLGAHGAISAAPAENIQIREEWQNNNFVLSAKGIMREQRMNKYNLKLEREIKVIAGERKLYIDDTITNESFKKSPLMIMYHINIGYPVLSEKSKLFTSLKSLLPRDPDAFDGKEKYMSFEKPQKEYFEKCYFHIMNKSRSGKAMAGIFNPSYSGGIGINIEWNIDNLPRMTQWKMLGKGLYVSGLEPSNCWGNSVVNEVKTPEYKPLLPWEERKFSLAISVVSGKKEIDESINKIKSLGSSKIEYLEPIIKERSKSL